MKPAITYLLSMLLLYSCSSHQSADESSGVSETAVVFTQVQLKQAGIVCRKAITHRFTQIHRFNGMIEVPPQNMVSISFPFGGYLQASDLLPGMHVKKGQVLAYLQDASYVQIQQEFLMAKIHLTRSEKEWERQQTLYKEQASTEKSLQQAQADYLSLKVEVKAMAEKLRLVGINPETFNEDKLTRTLAVLSPINGFVSHVNVNIGKYVNPTDVLFQLVNPDDIHLAISAYEKDLAKLKIGQEVICSAVDFPEKKHRASIILISRNIDTDRTASVHCHFEEYDHSLLPGMYMNAEVYEQGVELPAIPLQALVEFEGKSMVFTATNNYSFEMREVEVVAKDERYVSVITLSGASLENQSIVVKNPYSILMALKNRETE
jgi:cobalt-zinc-cadmium efflux system membrane fusion protein